MTDLSWNWSQRAGWLGTESKQGTKVQFSKSLHTPTSSLVTMATVLCQTFEHGWKVLFLISNYEELCKEKVKIVTTVDTLKWSKWPCSGLQYKSYLAESEPTHPIRRKGLKGIKELLGEIIEEPTEAVLEVKYVLQHPWPFIRSNYRSVTLALNSSSLHFAFLAYIFFSDTEFHKSTTRCLMIFFKWA